MQSTTSLKKNTATRASFRVPVFPHLKKFIEKTYGAGIIRTEETTVLGRLVTAALRDVRVSKGYKGMYGQFLPSVEIHLKLTSEQANLGPRLSKLLRLNVDMDRVFKESLLSWINAQGEAGLQAYPACRAFLQYYGIDEKEYSLDAAYKYWQRTRSL